MIDGRLFLTDNGRNSVTLFESASGPGGRTIVLRRGPVVGNEQASGIGLTGLTSAGGALWLPDWDANKVYRVPLAKFAP